MSVCDAYSEARVHRPTFHTRHACHVEREAHHQPDCEDYAHENLAEIIGRNFLIQTSQFAIVMLRLSMEIVLTYLSPQLFFPLARQTIRSIGVQKQP